MPQCRFQLIMGEQQLRATPPLGVVTELQVMKSNKKYSFSWLQSSRQTVRLSSRPTLQGYRRALPLYKEPRRSLPSTAVAKGWGVPANLWVQIPEGGRQTQTPFLAVRYKTIDTRLLKWIFKLNGVVARIDMPTYKGAGGGRPKALQWRELAFALIHKFIGLFTINKQHCQPGHRFGQWRIASF